MPKILEITRAYSGQEGHRVRPGDKFVIDGVIEGLPTISGARANQLKGSKLARDYTGDKPFPTLIPRVQASDGVSVKQPVKTQLRSLNQSKGSKKPEAAPVPPRPIQRPAGSQTGRVVAASLSPADRASSGSSSIPLRGERRSG